MNRLMTILVGLEIFLLGGGQGWCADFKKGHEAYRSGNCATALREWKPLEENKGIFLLFSSKEDVINAQYFLGVMYDNGQSVPKDGKFAVKWFRLAAKQGNALNQTAQGVKYANGKGVPQGYKIAVKWYKLAAAQGWPCPVQSGWDVPQRMRCKTEQCIGS